MFRRLPSLSAREAATLAVPLGIVLLFAALALWRPALLEDALENPLLDWRFHARASVHRRFPPRDVAVVAIDEKSLGGFGSWPWPADRIARLVERIAQGKPRVLVVDLLFNDPGQTEPDERLARAVVSLGERAILPFVFEVRPGAARAESQPGPLGGEGLASLAPPGLLHPLEAARAILPPPALANAATLGHANYLPDRFGMLWRERLFIRYDGELFPSLALQAARVARGVPRDQAGVTSAGGLRLGGETVPADARGALLVNYYGGEGAIARLSAGDLLSGEVSPVTLEGAVVFVGATGSASYASVATPFSASLPVVEKDATVAANLVAGDFLREAPPALDLLVVLLCGAAVFLACRLPRAGAAFGALVLLAAALAAGNLLVFAAGWKLGLAYPLALVAVQGAAALGERSLAEQRKSRETRRIFSSYVSERLMDRLIENPRLARLGGERRELTVLFLDIRGFTSYAERHGPEEVVATLNEYLGAMTEVVFRWEGTLDKFIGDAVMAFWGAPVPQENHAERALRCALEMQVRIAELNERRAAQGREALAAGIGISTGEVIVGNIGAEGKKMEYTVIGDHVNLASRVEALTKRFGSRILLTESTFAHVRRALAAGGIGHVAVRGLDEVNVRGKERPVRLYEVAPLEHGEATTVEEAPAGAAR